MRSQLGVGKLVIASVIAAILSLSACTNQIPLGSAISGNPVDQVIPPTEGRIPMTAGIQTAQSSTQTKITTQEVTALENSGVLEGDDAKTLSELGEL